MGNRKYRALSDWNLIPCHYCRKIMYYHRPAQMSKVEFEFRRPTRDHVNSRELESHGIFTLICCRGCNELKADMPYRLFMKFCKIYFKGANHAKEAVS